jgi:tyrosyl-tRNA synthetase
MTFRLLTTSAGIKMGKTAKGAVWLDPAKTKPFEFYQYWRNIDDADVINCMKLLTFLPMDEIRGYAAMTDAAINDAKKRLAYEVTKIVHGQGIADDVSRQASDLFEGAGQSDQMARTVISPDRLANGLSLLDLLAEIKLIPSKGEGRRLMQQNGIYLNDKPVSDFTYLLSPSDFTDNQAIIRKGKKIFHCLTLG